MRLTKRKATFRFAEDLLEKVSEQAASQDKTATDLIEGFIREGLAKNSLESSPSSSQSLKIDQAVLLEFERRIAFLESEVSHHKSALQEIIDKSTSIASPQNDSMNMKTHDTVVVPTNASSQETKREVSTISQKEFQEMLGNLFEELKRYIDSVFTSNQNSDSFISESSISESITQTDEQNCNRRNTSFDDSELILQEDKLVTVSELEWLTFQQAFTLAQASGYSGGIVAFRSLIVSGSKARQNQSKWGFEVDLSRHQRASKHSQFIRLNPSGQVAQAIQASPEIFQPLLSQIKESPLIPLKPNPFCPRCKDKQMHADGSRGGYKRYRCNRCGKSISIKASD